MIKNCLKKGIKFIAIFTVITTMFFLVQGTYAVGADFYITDVEPTVVTPGETTTLNITLKNLGTGYAAYLRAVLDPDDVSPISAVGETKKYINTVEAAGETNYFGVVNQGKKIDVSYPIEVDDSAAAGTYNVPLKLVWENQIREEQTETLYISMAVTGTPRLVISGVNTSPSRIYADSEFTLTVDIENIGTGKAKSVETKLTFPSEFSGERTAFPGTIERDTRATTTYDLKVSKEAESGGYDFGLFVSFIDEDGTEYLIEKNFSVYVSERGDIDLEIAGLDTSPGKIVPGSDFTLSIQIENIGTQDAKAVKAEVALPPEFTGKRTSFVGSLKEDDTSTAIFDLAVLKDAKPGQYESAITFYYLDEKGKGFADRKEFSLDIAPPEKKSPVSSIVVGLLIVIVAVYLLRRRRESEI